MKRIITFATLGVSLVCINLQAARGESPLPVRVRVDTDKPGIEIPKTLYGLFYEDLNYAGDGGIYPELLRNRGFDWQTTSLEGWEKDFRGSGLARLSLPSAFPLHPNSAQYLRLEIFSAGSGPGVGIRNHGFHGIAVKQGDKFDLSFHVRPHPGYTGGVRGILESDGKVLAEYHCEQLKPSPADPMALDADPGPWQKLTAVLEPSESATNATFSLLFDAKGTIDLELVSLYPQATFNKRPNGLRPDLMQMLKDLNPGVLRFPGGSLVAGLDLDSNYNWKKTIGPLERRGSNRSNWTDWQSYGLGYFEYFQMAEDLGAEPMPILTAAVSGQHAGQTLAAVPLADLDWFVQDACDLIEFANGPPDSKWGRVRAEMGHPEPFHMKYLGLGNECVGMDYLERFLIISREVKARHPEITLVASSGWNGEGANWDLAWKILSEHKADMIDEHYYMHPGWFLKNAKRYDTFDRNGPKSFVGEWACHINTRANTQFTALCEAAMMTGFERNSDVVRITAYAPLFGKVGHDQWRPNLIWFDNTRAMATPNYHVQKLFAANRPTRLLPLTHSAEARPLKPRGRIGLRCWDTSMEFKDFRVTRGGETLYQFKPADGLKGWSANVQHWQVRGDSLALPNRGIYDPSITLGSTDWDNYTITCKARKIDGDGGFVFRLRDNGISYLDVQIGGNNLCDLRYNGDNPVASKPAPIEAGRWYDVELTLDGDKVSVSVDQQLLFDRHPVPEDALDEFFAVAGLDETAGEIVIKCVNVKPEPMAITLDLAGASPPKQAAKRITLSAPPDAENDLENPTRVSPTEDTFEVSSNVVNLSLAPSSLTVLRIRLTETACCNSPPKAQSGLPESSSENP